MPHDHPVLRDCHQLLECAHIVAQQHASEPDATEQVDVVQQLDAAQQDAAATEHVTAQEQQGQQQRERSRSPVRRSKAAQYWSSKQKLLEWLKQLQSDPSLHVDFRRVQPAEADEALKGQLYQTDPMVCVQRARAQQAMAAMPKSQRRPAAPAAPAPAYNTTTTTTTTAAPLFVPQAGGHPPLAQDGGAPPRQGPSANNSTALLEQELEAAPVESTKLEDGSVATFKRVHHGNGYAFAFQSPLPSGGLSTEYKAVFVTQPAAANGLPASKPNYGDMAEFPTDRKQWSSVGCDWLTSLRTFANHVAVGSNNRIRLVDQDGSPVPLLSMLALKQLRSTNPAHGIAFTAAASVAALRAYVLHPDVHDGTPAGNLLDYLTLQEFYECVIAPAVADNRDNILKQLNALRYQHSLSAQENVSAFLTHTQGSGLRLTVHEKHRHLFRFLSSYKPLQSAVFEGCLVTLPDNMPPAKATAEYQKVWERFQQVALHREQMQRENDQAQAQPVALGDKRSKWHMQSDRPFKHAKLSAGGSSWYGAPKHKFKHNAKYADRFAVGHMDNQAGRGRGDGQRDRPRHGGGWQPRDGGQQRFDARPFVDGRGRGRGRGQPARQDRPQHGGAEQQHRRGDGGHQLRADAQRGQQQQHRQ
jgi:hypothetical protein